MIFSWGDLQYTDAFQNAYPEASIQKMPVRFTTFFHVQQFWNLDLNNNIGFFTGIGLRNIGIISNEYLPTEINYASETPYAGDYFQSKIIRRTFSLGVPLAFKVGSFKDNLHIYAGGEMEWSFHMKEKYWKNNTRTGGKSKNTEWFPNQITTLLPSAFVGLQLPKGVNIKFKYYLENFLNQDYKGYTANSTTNQDQIVSDLTRYESSNIYYISLSFHFKTAKLIKQLEEEHSTTVASTY
jgi:hypothetical protein